MRVLDTEHGPQYCLFREKKSPKLKVKRKLLKMIPTRSEWNWNKRDKDGSEISPIRHF